MKKSFSLFLLFLINICASSAFSQDDYFIMGSGQINFKSSSGATGTLTYRNEKGYDEAALRKINQVYGGNYDDYLARMSLRFLEAISNIQNHFGGAPIIIRSGYRSPRSNQGLRNQGKMAAQSSMHIEAAAIDFYIQGVNVLDLKEYATQLPCCGVGYYHGKHIHLDTGPKRWWDETNSGTDKKEAQENEKIILLMQKDIYSPKDRIAFDFARVSDFPIGVKATVQLEKWNKEQWNPAQNISIENVSNTDCLNLQSRKEIKQLALKNSNLNAGRYRMRVDFCGQAWSKMPPQIYSDPFEVR